MADSKKNYQSDLGSERVKEFSLADIFLTSHYLPPWKSFDVEGRNSFSVTPSYRCGMKQLTYHFMLMLLSLCILICDPLRLPSPSPPFNIASKGDPPIPPSPGVIRRPPPPKEAGIDSFRLWCRWPPEVRLVIDWLFDALLPNVLPMNDALLSSFLPYGSGLYGSIW